MTTRQRCAHQSRAGLARHRWPAPYARKVKAGFTTTHCRRFSLPTKKYFASHLRLFVSEMPADDDACATSETQLESTTATHHRRFFIANGKISRLAFASVFFCNAG